MNDASRRSVLFSGGFLFLSASAPAQRGNDAARSAALPAGGQDADGTVQDAFSTLSDTRTSPPGLPGWGVGAIRTPRGLWTHRTPIRFADSQVGFSWRGDADYATTHLFDIARGSAVTLKTYVAVTLSDFRLQNRANPAGDSTAIALDPVGGGGLLTIKRLSIAGFGTGIRVDGDGNGDKTLVEQVTFATRVGFDNGRNKQAVGWTFLNCAGGCADTHFRLGGAGEVAVINHVGDVYGSLVHLPESSGNAGAASYPGRITISGTKLEYHGTGDRLLVDARASRLLTEAGGSNVEVVLRDVSLASGPDVPDPSTHVVIQVGDEHEGSDAVRVRQDGGWVEGVIRHGSRQMGALNRRWAFRDALRAPDPARVDLQGPGSHPLMEWRANENVPVDQYRGGEAFTGAIDAQKAFLWRHVGPALINTGVASRRLGGRVGERFAIGGFPPGTTQTGLALYLDAPLAVDLQIQQFTDNETTEAVASSRSLPAGTPKGLHRIHDAWTTLADGLLHIQVTLPGAGLIVRGAIVPFYFPYMGS